MALTSPFNVFQVVEQATGLAPINQSRLIETALIIFSAWAIQQGINAILVRQIRDTRTLYYWKKSLGYSVAFLALVLSLRVWFAGVGDLATFFGLLSAGIAIALRDPLVNLAGWAFILWRRPFRVGDRVEIGPHKGDVIDQRLFAFSLMEIGSRVDAEQSTGRVIYIPNAKIFNEPLANYHIGFNYLWIELPVLVTFESDWKPAKKILEDIAEEKTLHLSKTAEKKVREASRKMVIFYSKLTPVVYTTVKESGVLLTIRCLSDPRQIRGTEQSLWEAVLNRFAEHDTIDFAYPSQRVYLNALEGKPGARAALPEWVK